MTSGVRIQELALSTRSDLSRTVYLHVLFLAAHQPYSSLSPVVILTHASKSREYQAGRTCPEKEVVWSITSPIQAEPLVGLVGLVGVINVTERIVCLIDVLDVYLMKV